MPKRLHTHPSNPPLPEPPERREPRTTDLEVLELMQDLCLPFKAALRVYAACEA